MIEPVHKDDAFLADVKAAQADPAGFHLWWLGQSGFLIQWKGRHLLIDPYLSDSLTRKYAHTDKPHVRMTARVTSPDRLNFIDVVTSSHNHTDHLDAETLQPLLRVNPGLELIIPGANRQFVAERLQVDPGTPLGVDEGTTVEAAGFSFTGIPAAHETVERDALGRCKFLGYLIRFGGWSLYHSGDCVPYDGLVERLQRWPIDVALLPINGRAPERGVAGNFTGSEAAALAKQISAKLVIPCHYDMFEFNTASPAEFAQVGVSIQQRHKVLRCAERWSSSEL
jgi:L-ascorbate metabolism protein UlaG (beta-lactamase superfamily)